MKKIINGRKYDTATAKLIGHYTFSDPRDFCFCDEDLYRKRTGEFFLAGEGGPASKYAHRCDDNSRTGGEGIIPLTEEEAREWVEQRFDADQYEAIFGEVEE